MDRQDLINIFALMLVIVPILCIYFFSKRSWYVRFDKGDGCYAQDPEYIYAHTFEGAKRKAKRMVARNNWEGFKLRPH